MSEPRLPKCTCLLTRTDHREGCEFATRKTPQRIYARDQAMSGEREAQIYAASRIVREACDEWKKGAWPQGWLGDKHYARRILVALAPSEPSPWRGINEQVHLIKLYEAIVRCLVSIEVDVTRYTEMMSLIREVVAPASPEPMKGCTCPRAADCPHHGYETPDMVDIDI